jgi:hypothetical protein
MFPAISGGRNEAEIRSLEQNSQEATDKMEDSSGRNSE